MINSIYELAKFWVNYDIDQNHQQEGKIIFIDVDMSNKNVSITVEDYIPSKRSLYLYYPDETKGNNSAIFAQITKPEKTFSKVFSFLEKMYEFSKSIDEKIFFNPLIYTIQKNSEKIIHQISFELEDIKSNKNYRNSKVFLGVKISKNGVSYYPGQIEVIKRILQRIRDEKLTSNTQKSICFFCQDIGEISPVASTVFKFYTVDKPGFIASSQIINFEKSESWINYPVCINCYEILKKSKDILKNKLSFNMEGIRYFIIPTVIFNESEAYKQIVEIIDLVDRKQLLDQTERITTDQMEILKFLGEKNFVYFYMVFYEEINSAERILLVIEDIPPTTFNKIFLAKQETEKVLSKYNTLKKYDISYNTLKLRRILVNRNKVSLMESEKLFLDYIEKIFRIQPVDYIVFIKYSLFALRASFNEFHQQPFGFEFQVIDCLSSLLFFYNLGLLDKMYLCGGESMFENLYKDLNLNTFCKQGLFMLGCLCRLLLDEQRRRLNNMPFLNKLKSFRMNKKDFMELLPSIIDKFHEYDYYGKLQDILVREVSEKLLKTEWDISNEEMNFYFACGMALHRAVKQIVYGGDNID